MSCLLIFTSIYPLTRLTGLVVEMYRMKRLLNFLETRTLSIQQKITGKVGLYTNTHRKLQFQSLGQWSLLKKKWKVFYNNTKVINRVFISCITDWTQTKLIKAKTYRQTKWMFHINKSFHLIHFKPNLLFWSGVHWNECKQTWKVASLEPANFELSKLYHQDVQSLSRFSQLNFDT